MLRKAERFAVHDAQRFEQSVAQQKATVVHRHDRLSFRQKLPVEKNHHGINS